MSYEDILRNPDLLHAIEQRARRERGIAIRELFARLFTAIKTAESRTLASSGPTTS